MTDNRTDSNIRCGSAPNFCPPVEEGMVIAFQDEKGDIVSLEFLGLVTVDGVDFGFFFPVDEDNPALSSGEVIVLEVVDVDEEGVPVSFELVDDAFAANCAYEEFKRATKDLYRFE